MMYDDAETAAAAQSALGHPLASFTSPTSDPGVNNYADANFLRGRLTAHIDGIRNSVLAAVPNAKFEML